MSLVNLELKLLFRNRGFLLQLAVYLVLSLGAVVIGFNHYNKQLTEIEKQHQFAAADIAQWQAAGDKATPGGLGYYLHSPAVKTPSPWSILFKGESQELLTINRIRLLALQGQLYNEPINNSEHLRLTWLDLGFVWVYLLPLLIGFITVTRLAEDKQTGRWQLFSANLSTGSKLLITRIAISVSVLFILNVLVLLAATAFTDITLSLDTVWLLTILFCYMLFWASVSYLISKLVKQANLSVLAFVVSWLVLAIAIPSARFSSQLDVSQSNTGVSLLMTQRQSINDSWDRDKQADLDTFLAAYPKWQETSKLGEAFDWKWYYAMQTLSDDAAKPMANDYLTHIENANKAPVFRALSPVLNVDLLLTRLANTDRQSDLDMKAQVTDWYNALKDHWYPYLFFNKAYSPQAIADAPKFSYLANTAKDALQLLWLLLLTACLIALSYKRKY
ncbi:DUF3526 domain-containing protein [Pseudoalteromonas spongiae]|uniref:DUF3526 domain-containing protein n=1 Tax=Pseudoalteromonas spongiae TaxID=298657 RepID=UPI00110B7482|nr:DUF3526 domain-containing protein [Pseudoalteromonas spongiae]TMO84864.1 hypothetical protein CWC15_09780 [Pseudoalteromonas spongiae]